MKIKEVNTQTGEEIEREMNADELAQREADAVAYAEQKALDDAAAQAKASAFNKLEALGLTAEEVATIIDGLKQHNL